MKSIEQIARVLKQPQSKVTAEAEALNIFIGANWAGEPAVSEPEAEALVSGRARREADHDRAWREHLAAKEAYEIARDDTRREAFTDAYHEALRTGIGAPQAVFYGGRAAESAVEKYEKAHEPPVFQGSDAATAPSLFGRIKEAVK